MDLVERLAERINLNADVHQPEEAHTPRSASIMSDALADDTVVTRLDRQTFTPIPGKVAEQVDLDLDGLDAKGYLTPDTRHNLLAEEYRIIKRPLLRTAFNSLRSELSRDHVALVTSAQPSEGKTFTSINLGMSVAAEADYHVLLVDADVRQRGLSRAFGMANRKGLTDVLNSKDMSVADVIVRTNVPNLSILPAGQAMKSPTEMFASQRMKDIVDEMARRYADRFIIFDSPPAMASSEPGVLAGYVGQVIMVTMAGETPKQALTESLAMVDACPHINFILNKVTLFGAAARFGYYGYYGEN